MSADDETSSSFSVPDSPSPPSSPDFINPSPSPSPPSPFLSALDSFPLSVPHFINPIPPQQPHQPPPNAPSPSHSPTTFNPNSPSSSNPNPNQAQTPSQPALALPDEKEKEITNLQQIIQHLSGGDFDETKYAQMDILEIAEKKGIVFANPSWWPPEGYPDTL